MESLTRYLLVSAIVLFAIVFYKWLLRYLQRNESKQDFAYFFPFKNKHLGESELLSIDMPYTAVISAALITRQGVVLKVFFEKEFTKGVHAITLDFTDVENDGYILQIKSPFQLTRRKVEVRKSIIPELVEAQS